MLLTRFDEVHLSARRALAQLYLGRFLVLSGPPPPPGGPEGGSPLSFSFRGRGLGPDPGGGGNSNFNFRLDLEYSWVRLGFAISQFKSSGSCRFVTAVPDILGLVWPSFTP